MIAKMLKWQIYIMFIVSMTAFLGQGKIGFLSAFFASFAIFFTNCLMAMNQMIFRINPMILLMGILIKPFITILLLLIVVKSLTQISWLWFILGVVSTLMAIVIALMIETLFLNKHKE